MSESETGRTRCTLVFKGAAEDGRLSSGNIRLSARYIAFPVLIFRVLIGSASLRTKDGYFRTACRSRALFVLRTSTHTALLSSIAYQEGRYEYPTGARLVQVRSDTTSQ